MQAMSLGHTTTLREVHVSDEAILEFGEWPVQPGELAAPLRA